jgi:hypothetical protein
VVRTAVTAAAVGFLCWPMMCSAQMVGPTPQPPGIPVTPEEAEQVQPENWAIHAQGTVTWLLQPKSLHALIGQFQSSEVTMFTSNTLADAVSEPCATESETGAAHISRSSPKVERQRGF